MVHLATEGTEEFTQKQEKLESFLKHHDIKMIDEVPSILLIQDRLKFSEDLHDFIQQLPENLQ